MPVLRIPEPSIAQSLAPFGEALSNAWDPKTRAEAYALQQRIFLERFQLMKEQQAQQAANAAVQYYSSVVPPEKLGVIENMVRSGAPYDQVARAAADLGSEYIDSTDAHAREYNLQRYQRLNGGHMPDSPLTLVVGPNTAAQRQQEEVTQKGNEAYATAHGTQQAEVDVKGYPATAGTFPVGKGPLAAQTTQPAQPPAPPASGTAPGGPQQPPAPDQSGAAPTSPSASTSGAQPPATAPVADTGQGKVVYGPRVNNYTPAPVQYILNPGGQTYTTVPASGQNEEIGKQNLADLTDTIAKGAAADTAKGLIGRIRNLADFVHNASPSDQLDTALQQKARELTGGMALTPKQQAMALLNNYLTTELPALREQMGFRAMAKPEIQLGMLTTGSPTDVENVLQGIVSPNEALVDIARQKRDEALRVRNTQVTDPNALTYEDYATKAAALQGQAGQITEDYNRKYGVVGTPGVTPQQTTPQTGGPRIVIQQTPPAQTPTAPAPPAANAAPAPAPPAANAVPAPAPAPTPAPTTPAPTQAPPPKMGLIVGTDGSVHFGPLP